MVPSGAFVVKSLSSFSSSKLASTSAETENALEHGFARFAAAAALSLVILASPAPSLADGMSCWLTYVKYSS